MKHGVAFRKLSRTSSHRMLMLRNLVSSLLEHEQIKTTLPKAKETARLAEKILSLGKKGDLPAQRQAAAFLLNPDKTLPLLFGSYAERYQSRPGGYTRIHKFGHRKGDHAPHAILELCDNPRDIKFELTARAVGRQTVQRWLKTGGTAHADNVGEYTTLADRPWIRDITKVNYTQLMKFASEDRKLEFENKAIDWANHMLAEAEAEGGLRRPAEPDPKKPVPGLTVKHIGKRQRAGERLAGMSDRASSLGIASGAIGQGRIVPHLGQRSTSDVGLLNSTERTALVASKNSVAGSVNNRVWRSPFWEGGWKEALGDRPSQ
ncbi:hypothetical protein M407DRAFT_242877 [Tulasnella calospora MUT 4182]|uniref:Ribosomal protein L17 n=1 Tax=Tulasnella calospora MUT 4182 TaxID=1051891 RepID=A0A0C3QM55_9AGAM|nr:hypothetical protein M407DRAFT_242877 [Tulasnella calospora MUT 4182]